jgi:hypothetical protein
MIIILALLIIGIAITYSTWKYTCDSCHIGNTVFSAIVCSIVLAIVCGATWSSSYTTYLEARSFYSATKEQYHSAIEVYGNHAVIDMGKAAFTDFKYQGYQENVGEFVSALRNAIITYNKRIVEKRVMGKNPIFSWLIVEPDDDMVIIKMKLE